MEIKDLRPGEKVEFIIRRHWIVFVKLGAYFMTSFLISLVVIGFFPDEKIVYLLLIAYWLFLIVYLYIEWINKEFDMFIITNNRIIFLDQISFLNRVISECNMGQVQEVNSKTKGFLANIFNYGHIDIQTAGSNVSNFDMEFAPHSMDTARKILNIVDSYRDNINIEKVELEEKEV